MLDEIDELPDDNEQAFAVVEKLLRTRRDTGEKDEDGGPSLPEARTYVAAVKAAAEELEIQEFSMWLVPNENDKFWGFYFQFVAKLDGYLIRANIKRAQRARRYSIAVDPVSKIKIRHLIEQVKAQIDVLEISDVKKFSLQAKLNAFLTELERTRTRLESFAAAIVLVAQTGAQAHESLKPAFTTIKELMDSAATLLGREQEKGEAQAQLPPPEQQKRLPGPSAKEPPRGA